MKDYRKIAFVLVLGMVLAVSGLWAGGGGEKESAPSPKEEGALVIYSPNQQGLVDNIIPAFEKASGIKVQLISAGTGECWKRIESEQANPVADVIWGGQISNYRVELLMPYVAKDNDKVLPQYRNVDGVMTPYCLDGSVLLVHNELAKGITITGYADLLQPALKGKIIMGDPTSSSSAFAQLTNLLFDMGKGDYMADAAWNYEKQLLVQLDGKVAQSSGAVHRGVAGGEYTVGLTYEDPAAGYVRDGAPVTVVYMKEGVSFQPATSGIIKNCKHPEAAKMFMDYIVSKEAQDIIGTKLTVRPVRDDAQLGSYMKPFSQINIANEDPRKAKEASEAILSKYRGLIAK